MALNPEILGRPLFPSTQRTGEILQGLGRSLTNAITPSAGTPPATMAGVSIPPAGASLGQLQFTGPLINTSRFDQQAAPQPSQSAQPTFDYGTFAATRGLPTFDVTKTQTPSAAQSQINAGILTGQNRPSSFSVSAQQPFAVKQPVQPRIDTAVREGTISATPQQLANLNARTTAFEGRTPEQQQALLAQMRTQGAEIGGRLRDKEEQRQGELTKSYYAFRQASEERKAQEALTPKYGQVGRDATQRGAQAMIEAERWKQAQVGRSPMSREPLEVGGMQFRQGSMGQFEPIRNLNMGSFSKVSGGASSSFGGGFPSFNEWLEENQKTQSLGDVFRGNQKVPSVSETWNDFILEQSRERARAKQRQDEWIKNTIESGGSVKSYFVQTPSGLPKVAGYYG